jgi:hypothetical protein
MARAPSFNFGFNKKPRKKKGKRKATKKATGKKSNAWRQYIVSNTPIPD